MFNKEPVGYNCNREGFSLKKFQVAIIPDKEDGGYYVEVPGLPGCVTQGETIEECLINAKEAIEVYLDGLEDQSDLSIDPIFASVEVDYMPPLPVISGNKAVKAFQRAGFDIKRQKGSHVHLDRYHERFRFIKL